MTVDMKVWPEAVVDRELATLHQLAYSEPSEFRSPVGSGQTAVFAPREMFPLDIWDPQSITFCSFTPRLGDYRGGECWKDFSNTVRNYNHL
jgi:hypothetical protein